MGVHTKTANDAYFVLQLPHSLAEPKIRHALFEILDVRAYVCYHHSLAIAPQAVF